MLKRRRTVSRNREGEGGEPCDYREQRFSPTIESI